MGMAAGPRAVYFLPTESLCRREDTRSGTRTEPDICSLQVGYPSRWRDFRPNWARIMSEQIVASIRNAFDLVEQTAE